MSLGVHALNVRVVVLALRTVTRNRCRTDAHGATGHQTCSRADRSALAATDCRSGDCTNRSADDGTADSSLVCSLLCCRTTDLGIGKLATLIVVIAEAVHRATRAGKDQHTGPGRHYSARTKHQSADQGAWGYGNTFWDFHWITVQVAAEPSASHPDIP